MQFTQTELHMHVMKRDNVWGHVFVLIMEKKPDSMRCDLKQSEDDLQAWR